MGYADDALAVEARIGPGPRCVVIGSTEFWGADSEQICLAIGDALASVENLTLVTGGVEGVGETVGRAFLRRRQQLSFDPRVLHLLPHGEPPWDYGETIFAGTSMHERREILGRLAGVFVSIEGGPGTAHEADVAKATGRVVVPVARTGGASVEIYKRMNCPKSLDERLWGQLADPEAGHTELAAAVRNMTIALSTTIA